MIQCPNCSSESTVQKGKEFRYGKISQRCKCKSCNTNFYEDIVEQFATEQLQIALKSLVVTGKNRTWVIGSIVNDVAVNEKFLTTIKTYCYYNNAELKIVPVKYDQNGSHEYNYPEELKEYFVTENIKLTTGLKLLAGIHVSPAIGNPIVGFENFSQGDSIIIPHPQMMMKSIAMSQTDPSAIITTTGAITEPTYTSTKQGTKADYNHSYSVIVVEEDSSIDGFHFRVLNSSEDGSFYDLDCFYDGEQVTEGTTIEAIILGDEHIRQASKTVTEATFTNTDSIVNTLKPKYIIRHDVLDFQSASHHHNKNVFLKYAKYISNKDDVADELKETVEYILNTTPDFAKSIIISSNHNSHLLQWLNESNPKLDSRNALLYHELMYLMLKETKMTGCLAEFPNPLELWSSNNYEMDNVQFIGEQESFKIGDIELSYHGHRGTNGSRGNALGFSKLGNKSIVGHSHSP